MTLLALALLTVSQSDEPTRWQALRGSDGVSLDHALVLPEGYDESKRWPVLVALPPGAQDRAMVERGLELYFEREATRRGWVVASPVAPDGDSLDALLDHLGARFLEDGARPHLVGVSNGGRSAFAFAASNPRAFASLTVLPGVPPEALGPAELAEVAQLPLALWVGGDDAGWLEASRITAELLRELGAPELRLEVVEGTGHVLDASVAPDLFDHLDRVHVRERERAQARAAVAGVLDELHDAAAKADESRYFSQFAPGAIFVGTDATERWTVPEFRAYAAAPFERESAWTYWAVERHVELSTDGRTAWFDERLMNEKYGETRGSGVLVLTNDRWRIAHYVLSFPIPNDATREVVRIVREAGD